MGYKNRYLFAKRTYQETIILFKVNKKYLSYLDTLSFLKYLKFHNNLALLNKLNINYIIINNNMQIIKLVKFKENKYKLYYKKFVLFKILEEIKEMIT